MGSFQKQSEEDFRVELERKRRLRGWNRLGSSFHNAFNGFLYVWQTELNFRIEIVCAMCAISLAIVLDINFIPILLCCGWVLSLELVNSTIEKLVDLVSPNYHPLAQQAKDIAAASVLLAAAISVGVAIILFVPALIALLFELMSI